MKMNILRLTSFLKCEDNKSLDELCLHIQEILEEQKVSLIYGEIDINSHSLKWGKFISYDTKTFNNP